ncbi:MAG: mechanosensitive ion channel family protein [Candidatus Poseidoniales archaeon]
MEQIVTAIPDYETMILGFNLGSLVGLAFVLVVILISRKVAEKILPRVFKAIEIGSEVASNALKSSGKALGVAIGSGIGLMLLGDLDNQVVIMPGFIESWLPKLLELSMVIALILTAFRFVGIIHAFVVWLDDDGDLDGSQKTVVSAAESVVRFVVVIFGSAFVAASLGFDLSTLIAGLGITGLAIALAAKDTLSNIFGATTVLLDRPFKIGDWVIIDSVEGEIMEIGLRTTLIRTSLDTVVTMPNANLTSTPVENWGKRRFRRWQPVFKLDINSDPDHVETFCAGIISMIEKHDLTMKEDSSFARVSALGPDAIDVGCNIYWDITSGTVEKEAREGLLLAVMNLAKDNKLDFHDPRKRHN